MTLQVGTAVSIAASRHQWNWFNLQLGLLPVKTFTYSLRVPWVLQFPPTNTTVGGLCAWYNKQKKNSTDLLPGLSFRHFKGRGITTTPEFNWDRIHLEGWRLRVLLNGPVVAVWWCFELLTFQSVTQCLKTLTECHFIMAHLSDFVSKRQQQLKTVSYANTVRKEAGLSRTSQSLLQNSEQAARIHSAFYLVVRVMFSLNTWRVEITTEDGMDGMAHLSMP